MTHYIIDSRPMLSVVIDSRVAVTVLTVPTAASNLTATAISFSQIDLAWTDNSDNESGFKVQRSTSMGGPYTTIATTAADATSYSDTTVSASTTYYYVIVATNAAGDGDASNEATDTTPTQYLVQDTFTDTNGVLLTAHTPDVDNGDTTYAGLNTNDIEVQSGRIQRTGGGSGTACPAINAGAIPSRVQVTYQTSSAGAGSRIRLWFSSAGGMTNDGIGVAIFPDIDRVDIREDTTLLATDTLSESVQTGVDYYLRADFNSGTNEITVSFIKVSNGATIGTVSHTYIGTISDTNIGIQFDGPTADVKLDDFEVTQ